MWMGRRYPESRLPDPLPAGIISPVNHRVTYRCEQVKRLCVGLTRQALSSVLG
jgi:hypothetical protein